jgi:hypothetical protein
MALLQLSIGMVVNFTFSTKPAMSRLVLAASGLGTRSSREAVVLGLNRLDARGACLYFETVNQAVKVVEREKNGGRQTAPLSP